jgi:CPA2 family monovalent cation:H+ antiporter-2
MSDTTHFLQDLAMVLCVAAVTTLIFQRLRQPPVLGYLLAGLLLGPHVSLPLYADENTVRTLASLGVILVMFSIGLTFSIERLIRVLPTAGLTLILEVGIMIWLGYCAALVMGWTPLEGVFTGAMLSISSTMISSKALADQKADEKLTRAVVNVLVLQDLAAVLLVAVLTPMARGAKLSLTALATTSGTLLAFLSVLFVAGYLIIPRLIRLALKLRNPETLLVTAVGICFVMALAAEKGGYSVALGAFLAGMLVAESGATLTLERLIHPIRDMFAAIFFVAIGMLVDPAALLLHWRAVVFLTLLVIGGQMLSVSIGAFLSGRPVRTAIQAGMSLAQIGEFSFIIAQVGTATGAISGFLYDVAVAVSVVTAFTTPWLIRAAGPVSQWVDNHLPAPLQTFAALYGSWLEALRSEKQEKSTYVKAWQLIGLLLLDVFCLIVIVITTASTVKRWLPQWESLFHIPPEWGKVVLIAAGLILAVPFSAGIFRCAKNLGGLLAEAAIPAVKEGLVDLGLAPRKLLTVTLQLGIVFAVGVPLLALTQPFLPFGSITFLLVGLLAVLGFAFWKSAINLQDHVHAGAQMVTDALTHHSHEKGEAFYEQMNAFVPGLGSPTPVSLGPHSAAAGKTLLEMNLRNRTGVGVIAIMRGKERILMPPPREVLQTGDTLILVGTQQGLQNARTLLV